MNNAISTPTSGRPAIPLAGLLSPHVAGPWLLALVGATVGALLSVQQLQARTPDDGWMLAEPPSRNVTAIYAACAGIEIRNRAADVVDAAMFDCWLETLRDEHYSHFPADEQPAAVDYGLRDFIQAQTKARYRNLSNEACEAFADACMTFSEPLKWCARGWAESSANTEAVNRSSGCSGWWQISPVHKPRMVKLGLDFSSEADRTIFAHVLADTRGDRPWVESERNRRKFQKQLETAWAKAQEEGVK